MRNSVLLPVLLVVSPVLSCHAAGKALASLGMWSWSRDAFATAAARKEMLDFCKREDITHIDQHVSIRHGAVQDADALRQLIVEATRRGVTVNALRGDRNMFRGDQRSCLLEQLKVIIAFDGQLPDGTKFVGLKYDVEPYLTPEWKAGGRAREQVIMDYLDSLKAVKDVLNQEAPHLKLSVDVPFWWDKPEYAVTFAGTSKPLVHHVQDLVDWIGIMSYRREERLILKFVEGEIAYAGRMKRLGSVAPGLETVKLSAKERVVTFWGTPSNSFRGTLMKLRQELALRPEVRCIMLHHYGSLMRYLKQEK